MRLNTKKFVQRVIGELRKSGIPSLLGGGWAQELQELRQPSEHKDVDLYYLGRNLQKIEQFIETHNYKEVVEKHFSHKRAFLVEGVMVEVVLIQQDRDGYFTDFWGKQKIYWPANLKTSKQSIDCLSTDALNHYQTIWPQIH